MTFQLRTVATAAALLGVLGGLAGASQASTLRLNMQNDVDSIDPAISYSQAGWQAEYATCLKLLNYPDAAGVAGKQLVPDAATALPAVSADGRTYTFTISRGLTFSPPSGEKVNAATFKHLLERLLTPALFSPAQPFLKDIVGAQEMLDGSATTLSGVTANGRTLTITLLAPHPDFLARVAMPFACAVPRSTPASEQQAPIPSAGPYYVSARTPQVSLTLTRNPSYHGDRPHAFDTISYRMGVDPATTEQEIEDDEADYAVEGLPPDDYVAINDQYGPGSPHQQFFVNPQLSVAYLGLNTSRPMMAHVKLRKAVNYAIDRPALIAPAGAFAGSPTDQILPPGLPGFADVKAYPLNGPNLAKARKLAAGLGGQVVLLTSNSPAFVQRATLIQSQLAQIGLDVQIEAVPRATQRDREGTRGYPFDITTEGWIADFADPYDFVNVLLDGRTIRDTGNLDVAYFDDPQVEAAMDAAAALSGQARNDAYAALDARITKDDAPWAAYETFNSRDFVSAAVAGVTYQPVYGLDLPALTPAP